MAVLQGIEFYISKRVGKALTDYKMLEDNDKILIGLSGGKDSLTLLKLMRDRQVFVPVKYSLVAVYVDFGYNRGIPARLAKYCKKIGVKFHCIKEDIFKGVRRKDINCFWCSWNRRRILFEAANRLGCTKVALGHHKDDIIETILMNMFFNGEISAMSARQELFDGKIVIIRPLIYTEEDMIIKFAKTLGVKFHTCTCPSAVMSNRTRMTKIISQIKKVCPDVKTNIFRSVRRIKKEYLP